MMIPASFFTSPPAPSPPRPKKKHKQTKKQRSLPASGRIKETKKASQQASKKERRRGGLEKKGVLGFFLVCFGFVSCSPFKCQTKHNTNTTLKPYITAFCGVFFI
jgi:hypothetical protein